MRQDVFSVAFQEAKSELLDITCRFEELRKRKEKLESVVTVLGPLLEAKGAAPVAHTVAPMPVLPVEPVADNSPQTNRLELVDQTSEDDITDPFQRRLRDALRFSTPSRDDLLKAI
ncbi:MAG TPA: hypothetical protein VN151_03515 [Terracidiphilus sp.]|nr:hypothetical protein [Terracidiphilus sp.]